MAATDPEPPAGTSGGPYITPLPAAEQAALEARLAEEFPGVNLDIFRAGPPGGERSGAT